MKIATSARVAAPRVRVFAALNDREVLRAAIPGCEELTDVDADAFAVQLKLGLAGIKGKYAGTAVRGELRPPESFTLTFDGKGTAGFVRGTASIRLTEQDATSLVECDADVVVGGAVASVGSRLIGAAARKLTDDFFRKLAQEIGARAMPPDSAST